MKAFEDLCPICEICGEPITDETFRRIGNECFHDSCIETVNTDTWVENRREDEYIREDVSYSS